jgi:hypothetical protein
MDPLEIISGAVALLQGVMALTTTYDQVSEVIAKRLREGRSNWNPDEEQLIADSIAHKRAMAVEAVARLPVDLSILPDKAP